MNSQATPYTLKPYTSRLKCHVFSDIVIEYPMSQNPVKATCEGFLVGKTQTVKTLPTSIEERRIPRTGECNVFMGAYIPVLYCKLPHLDWRKTDS
eukprot:1159064-Pelagomonas_calceolata.AAC.4